VRESVRDSNSTPSTISLLAGLFSPLSVPFLLDLVFVVGLIMILNAKYLRTVRTSLRGQRSYCGNNAQKGNFTSRHGNVSRGILIKPISHRSFPGIASWVIAPLIPVRRRFANPISEFRQGENFAVAADRALSGNIV
jgi:hypothetical protein